MIIHQQVKIQHSKANCWCCISSANVHIIMCMILCIMWMCALFLLLFSSLERTYINMSFICKNEVTMYLLQVVGKHLQKTWRGNRKFLSFICCLLIYLYVYIYMEREICVSRKLSSYNKPWSVCCMIHVPVKSRYAIQRKNMMF